jgi:hypothetical protein
MALLRVLCLALIFILKLKYVFVFIKSACMYTATSIPVFTNFSDMSAYHLEIYTLLR